MIVVRQLAKRFGDVVAVRDVGFTAPDGAVTGLLGPNGAGKSTTLRMLYTVLAPDGGSAHIDGIDVVADPQGARRAIGVLTHQAGIYPHLTARENIRYYGALQGLAGAALERRIDELIALLDLAEIADRRAKGFSQGQRVKTAIARALVHAPRNVLLDEPTNGLDVMATRALREIIRKLRDAGHCVLFSSHVMQEVAALCDSIVVIDRGRVVASGAPAALTATTGAATLEEAFVDLLDGGAPPS
jgi:sodium transport system ATP-binding protein